MRRLAALVVLAGLLLSLGCGKGDKTIDPKNVPPVPKADPTGKGLPGGQAPKSANAEL